MEIKLKLGLLAVLLVSGASAWAQCSGWNWPDDKATAEEKNVMYVDALNSQNYEAARTPHKWLLSNAPKLNTAIYINGEKIYKGLADKESDPAKKQAYVDSLMLIYDLRVENCGEEGKVLNRKAYAAYKYNIRQKGKLPEIMDLFDQAFALNGNGVDYYMLVPFMSTVKYNAKFQKNLSEDQILERYDKIMTVIDHKIANGEKVDKLKDYRGKIDGMLYEIVDINCDFVRSNMGPKFKENPSDIKLAKKIFKFMLDGKCTDDPLWLEAGKTVLESEPDFGLAKNLGLKCKAEKNFECAEAYFNQALELAEDGAQKSEIYIELGILDEKEGRLAAARQKYNMAINAGGNNTEAFNRIGYMYYSSFDRCKGGEDVVKDRAVFLVAFDKFQKAGNTKMMNAAREQFPSGEEIFTYNYEKGAAISVSCWINENTTIRSRD